MKRYWIFAGLLILPCAWYIAAQQRPTRSQSTSEKPARRTFSSRQSRSFSAAASRFDTWRVLGPGGGGAQYSPAINPVDPSLIFVACDMGGSYVSIDSGASWRQFNLGSRVNAFVFDPSNADTVYALAGQVFRSEDRGQTWSMVYPDPSNIIDIRYTDDEAQRLVLTNQGVVGNATALAIDAANPNSLYGAFGNSLQKSADRGRTWTQIGTFPIGNGLRVYIDPKSPQDNRSVYVLTRDRVGIYQNGQFRLSDPPSASVWFSDAAGGFAGDGGFIAYATYEHVFDLPNPKVKSGGLMVTRDLGRTWLTADDKLIETVSNKWVLPEYPALFVPADDPNTIWLSYTRLIQSSSGPSYFGLAFTADGGASWSLPWKEGPKPAGNVQDAWLTPAFTPYWGENPLGIEQSRANRDLVLTTDLGRTMRSTDHGSTWQAAYSKQLDDGSFATTGLDVTAATGLYFDPHDPNRLFLANYDIGVMRSENGGDGWISSNAGIPSTWLNTAYSIAFDPEVKGLMWAAVSGKHGIPSWFDVRAGITGFKGGIVISQDGGQTWTKSNRGLPEMAATDVIVDPSSPASSRTLFAAGYGAGVFKSVDGGASWTQKTNGISGENARAWKLLRDPRGALYLIVARRSIDNSTGTSNDGALYRSSDQAESWSRIALPEGVNGPLGIAYDPGDPDRLYLACWPRGAQYSVGAQGGVWRSVDGGRSWQNVFSKGQYVWDVTVDPADSNIVYAAGWQSSIWKSKDRGDTWSRIPGFNYPRSTKVVPDPRDASKIFVVTGGAGLWHGSSNGDADAQEDVISPQASFPGLERSAKPRARR